MSNCKPRFLPAFSPKSRPFCPEKPSFSRFLNAREYRNPGFLHQFIVTEIVVVCRWIPPFVRTVTVTGGFFC